MHPQREKLTNLNTFQKPKLHILYEIIGSIGRRHWHLRRPLCVLAATRKSGKTPGKAARKLRFPVQRHRQRFPPRFICHVMEERQWRGRIFYSDILPPLSVVDLDLSRGASGSRAWSIVKVAQMDAIRRNKIFVKKKSMKFKRIAQ